MLTRSKKQKVVLLKGFASRIKWNKQDHKEYANQAIKLAKNAKNTKNEIIQIIHITN